MITDENLDLLVNVINGKSKYRLPVVIITKTFYDEDPVDVAKLSKELKGVAHVFVQETNCTNPKIKEMCDGRNEYYGAIGIYHPNPVIGHRRYLYRMSEGIDTILSEKVTKTVMQYSNTQLVGPLFTWFGVNNAILQDRLTSKRAENAEAEAGRRMAMYELLMLKSDLDQKKESMRQQALEEAKAEADAILDGFEADLQKKDSEIERLTGELEKKERELSWLKAKMDSMTQVPIIYAGDEDDFYPGEAKDFVLSAVRRDLAKTEQRAAEAKRLLRNYSRMTPKIRKGLEDIGFIFDKSDHQKIKYYGDDRYTVIYASTSSDQGCGGENNVHTTIKKAF